MTDGLSVTFEGPITIGITGLSILASKVFNLNFLSPKIIKAVLAGTQPRTLKLQDIIAKQMPDLWQEQEEMLGF